MSRHLSPAEICRKMSVICQQSAAETPPGLEHERSKSASDSFRDVANSIAIQEQCSGPANQGFFGMFMRREKAGLKAGAESGRESGEVEQMTSNAREKKHHAIGPDGRPLTRNNLPLPSTKRWVIRIKAEVVVAVRSGLLGLDEACERYKITPEEFLAWQTALDQSGMRGLRATYRRDTRADIVCEPKSG